jgi:hypothetical protein
MKNKITKGIVNSAPIILSEKKKELQYSSVFFASAVVSYHFIVRTRIRVYLVTFSSILIAPIPIRASHNFCTYKNSLHLNFGTTFPGSHFHPTMKPKGQ